MRDGNDVIERGIWDLVCSIEMIKRGSMTQCWDFIGVIGRS